MRRPSKPDPSQPPPPPPTGPATPTSGAQPPRTPRPLTLGDLGVGFFFHIFYVGLPVLFVAAPLVLLWTRSWAWGVAWVVGYAAWFALTTGRERDGRGMPWGLFENNGWFLWVFEWFPLRLVATAAVDPGGQFIFAAHPHGALAFNRAMFGFCTSHYWQRAFPGVDFRVLAATASLRIPVIREVFMWSYCIDASRATAERALGRGTSLFLYPGGEREQILTQRGAQRLYLNKRKGFVKLALRFGASLVPIYVFGETDLYDHSSFLLGAREWCVARLGAAIMPISGSFGLLPHRVPVTAVSGAPIPVAKVDDPTKAQVDELHATYVAALRKLFDNHKAEHGYADAQLEIQ